MFLANKRETALAYGRRCAELGIPFVTERPGTRSNYWLNTILTSGPAERDAFLAEGNDQGVMLRPVWKLMPQLPAFARADPHPRRRA